MLAHMYLLTVCITYAHIIWLLHNNSPTYLCEHNYVSASCPDKYGIWHAVYIGWESPYRTLHFTYNTCCSWRLPFLQLRIAHSCVTLPSLMHAALSMQKGKHCVHGMEVAQPSNCARVPYLRTFPHIQVHA